MSAPEPPAERLDPNARWLWRLHGLIALVVAAVVVSAASPPAWLAIPVPVVVLVVGVLVVPELRWRLWRLAIDDVRLDLQRGGLVVRRTVVPVVRIQHVDSASDVLERLFGLATLTVHTAGGKVTVPGLRAARAADLARRIAVLARADDD